MNSKNKPTVLIKNKDVEAFNIGSVTSNPRGCTALDLKSATENLDFCVEGEVSDLVLATVRYLFIDYFSQAHQIGLYNRQLKLWESFSKIEKVQINRLSKGFFTKVDLPVYVLSFLAANGQVLALTLILCPDFAGAGAVDVREKDRLEIDYVRDFIQRATKVQTNQGGSLRGLFIALPGPSEKVYSMLVKATGGDDPVAKYDCMLGSPLNCHVNLITYQSELEDGSESQENSTQESEGDSALTLPETMTSVRTFTLSYPDMRRAVSR